MKVSDFFVYSTQQHLIPAFENPGIDNFIEKDEI